MIKVLKEIAEDHIKELFLIELLWNELIRLFSIVLLGDMLGETDNKEIYRHPIRPSFRTLLGRERGQSFLFIYIAR